MEKPLIQNKFNLDRFTGMQKGKLTFPSLYVESDEYMEQFAVLYDGLPSGTLPVVIGLEDKLVEVGRVSKDLTTAMRIVKHFDCAILVDTEVSIKVDKVEDLFDERIDWS